MKIHPPPPYADDPPRIRDLWPLVAGPLVLGGVIFWGAYFVHLFRGISGRPEVRWKPAPPAAKAPAEPKR